MNRRQVGADKETAAADFLENKGYQILTRNFYSRFGELDIVAKDGDCLVFCEVKYRTGSKHGDPEEAVTAQKLMRMQRTAQYYCIREQIPADTSMRFDVISILGEEIRHYQNVTGF